MHIAFRKHLFVCLFFFLILIYVSILPVIHLLTFFKVDDGKHYKISFFKVDGKY
jgi:hypothetical protein